MKEYFVVHIPCDREPEMARVFAEDDAEARLKGFALLEQVDTTEVYITPLLKETLHLIDPQSIVWEQEE